MRRPTRHRLTLATALALVLACCQSSEPGPGTTAMESAGGEEIFVDAAQDAGLDFHHFTGSTGEYFMPEIMGAGVALLDYESDGDLDVYFLQGMLLDPSKGFAGARSPPPAIHWPGNRMFQNELIPSGSLRFKDVTEQCCTGHEGYGMGVAAGDFDNDADPDLYVTNFGANRLYRNNGNGTFTDATGEGTGEDRWSASASFCDYDGDGLLDLFVANYIDFTVRNNKQCFDPTGARDYCAPTLFHPVPDLLLRNEGPTGFRDVSSLAGIGSAFGNGLGVRCSDWNADGHPDFYVANDGTPNQLWRNTGAGSFDEVGFPSGTAVNAHGLAEAGMGVASGDFDSDGDEDLFLTHLAKETNTLYLNNGHGEFRDVTDGSGLGSASFPDTGFGVAWIDYDNDGWLDLFVANGAVTIVEANRGEPYPFHQRNRLIRNLGGRGFEDVTEAAGVALQASEVSRGAAVGDIDNDGDSDIVLANNSGRARLLLNQSGNRQNWLQVRLEGVRNNRDGYGARVAVLRDARDPLWRYAQSDGSYLSASDPRLHFGLGESETISAVGVVWPDGSREVWRGVSANTLHTLKEGTGERWEVVD